MSVLVPIEQLSLSDRRPPGCLLSDTPSVRRRLLEFGFERPIPVRSCGGVGEFEVLGAVRHYLAAVRLGLSRVPVTVMDDLDETAADELVNASYVLKFDDPIDEAEFYREKLADAPADVSPSISRLARLTGKNRSYLSRTLALLELHPQVQRHISEARISRTHARYLAKVEQPQRQLALAERVIREQLSERALSGLVATAPARAAPAAPAATPVAQACKDPDTVRLERRVSDLLGVPFEIDTQAGVCTMRFFGDLEILDGLLERLGYSE